MLASDRNLVADEMSFIALTLGDFVECSCPNILQTKWTITTVSAVTMAFEVLSSGGN